MRLLIRTIGLFAAVRDYTVRVVIAVSNLDCDCYHNFARRMSASPARSTSMLNECCQRPVSRDIVRSSSARLFLVVNNALTDALGMVIFLYSCTPLYLKPPGISILHSGYLISHSFFDGFSLFTKESSQNSKSSASFTGITLRRAVAVLSPMR